MLELERTVSFSFIKIWKSTCDGWHVNSLPGKACRKGACEELTHLTISVVVRIINASNKHAN